MGTCLFLFLSVSLFVILSVLYVKKRTQLRHILENEHFQDLREYVAANYSDTYIDNAVIVNLQGKFYDDYKRAVYLNRKMIFFLVKKEMVSYFVFCYEHIWDLACEQNSRYKAKQLEENKDFFDMVLKYPLDEQQRRAVVSEATNCLVISSAGSGKTSSIVGKVKYLIEKKGIAPKRILLISYTNKAAAELTDRLGISGLRGYTFHKLAIDMIGRHTKEKPSICENTDAIFVRVYRELLKDKKFKRSVLQYFIDYQAFQTEEERRMEKERERLSGMKSNRYKSMFPDMDGRTMYVKSLQEQKLCFVLSSLGLKFRYEEPYEHHVADETHSQYRPDFSIHYAKGGKACRAYIEHFGVDEHGKVPSWFAQDKGLSYAEANRRYGDGITWKRVLHKKYGTLLLETSSADFKYFDVKEKIKLMLGKHNIPFKEIPDDDMYEMLLPEGSGKEKAFVRLVVTFITLMKTNCKTTDEILQSANGVNGKRVKLLVSQIVSRVYEKYTEILKEQNQKDFTDIILEATTIAKKEATVAWDYIIVDEFQDISVDRYKFLQALRGGNIPAKLFCVGDDWQSIYRFSGSDLALFNQFDKYFGKTEVEKIETTYRFGNPLVKQSSAFVQRNPAQIKKSVKPFSDTAHTELVFQEYEVGHYSDIVLRLVSSIPADKSVFLLGRYSFDDYYLSRSFRSVRRGNKVYYIIGGREIEFMTVHKSKGLEADYVILLQCNKGTFGFPATLADDPVLKVVLSKSDDYPYGEERRLFYVAITRAKVKTTVLYDCKTPSVFVDEFLCPEKPQPKKLQKKIVHKNANKHWEKKDDKRLLRMFDEGKTVGQMSEEMGRSYTSIVMRLQKLGKKQRTH